MQTRNGHTLGNLGLDRRRCTGTSPVTEKGFEKQRYSRGGCFRRLRHWGEPRIHLIIGGAPWTHGKGYGTVSLSVIFQSRQRCWRLFSNHRISIFYIFHLHRQSNTLSHFRARPKLGIDVVWDTNIGLYTPCNNQGLSQHTVADTWVRTAKSQCFAIAGSLYLGCNCDRTSRTTWTILGQFVEHDSSVSKPVKISLTHQVRINITVLLIPFYRTVGFVKWKSNLVERPNELNQLLFIQSIQAQELTKPLDLFQRFGVVVDYRLFPNTRKDFV